MSDMRSTIRVPRGWSAILNSPDILSDASSNVATVGGTALRDATPSGISHLRTVAPSTANPSANHDCQEVRPL